MCGYFYIVKLVFQQYLFNLSIVFYIDLLFIVLFSQHSFDSFQGYITCQIPTETQQRIKVNYTPVTWSSVVITSPADLKPVHLIAELLYASKEKTSPETIKKSEITVASELHGVINFSQSDSFSHTWCH